jgi:predicted dehydrogenase
VNTPCSRICTGCGEVTSGEIMLRGALIGAGGFASVWARSFLPAFSDRIEVVAIADIDRAALDRSADALGIASMGRFSSYLVMLDSVDLDVVFIVLPPAARLDAVRAAASRGVAILCEKPMAGTWQDTLAIGRIVRDTGIRFAVMQNYREQARIRTLKATIQRPDLGAINQVACRFAVNYTIDTAGGAFRQQIPDAFIYEGAEHHLDQLRNLTGVDADWVQGHQWGQPWSTFEGNTCLSLIIRMANGVMVQYEMNHVERGRQNGWHREYYRISAEGGSVILDADGIVRIVRDTPIGEMVEEVVPVAGEAEEHIALIARFLDWCEGGEPPFSVFEDNVRTMALTFAAIEATHTGNRIDVGSILASAGNLLN